jgi:hypothetical protein
MGSCQPLSSLSKLSKPGCGGSEVGSPVEITQFSIPEVGTWNSKVVE